MMNRKPLVAAGTLIGVGMGGFVDGIVFHQILQVHSLLSAKLPQEELINVKISMFWDGIFHALTWLSTAIGIGMLWNAAKMKDVPTSGRTVWGGLFLGWGLFNFIEGLIDHHLLEVHHVVERLGLSVYDYLFLASGAIFAIIGFILIRSGRKDTIPTHPSPDFR